MLSLAAFRYRDVLTARGGPIERLTCGERSVLGARWFEVNAYLSDTHAPGRSQRAVYGMADGTGTARSPLIARFKAVSEAIERWAQRATYAAGEGARYGFDVDPSSNGMAAFPGLYRRQARRYALFEAAERFNLMNWWEGRLRAREVPVWWADIRAIQIESSAPGVTVILQRVSPRGYTAYGHAAESTFDAACEKAAIELERHDLVVRYYTLTHAGPRPGPIAETAMHPSEQRCLFFALGEGRDLFDECVRRSASVTTSAQPQLLFDGLVPGPWSRYASVWRVLFAPPSERFRSNDRTYFLW